MNLHAQRIMARSARGGQPEENDTTAERMRPAGRVDPEAVAAGNCLEVSQDGSSASRAVCPSRTVKVRQHAPPGSQDASRHRTQPGGPQLASSHPNLHRRRPKTPSPSLRASLAFGSYLPSAGVGAGGRTLVILAATRRTPER